MAKGAKLTKAERRTTEFERRAVETMKRDYPSRCFNDAYGEPWVYHLAEFGSLKLVSVYPEKKDGTVDEDNVIYMVWTGGEFVSYEDGEEATMNLVNGIKERVVSERWMFFASPLIVSGTLAVGLLLTIVCLLLSKQVVPPELWSIFTAVIAFYFGKEGWTALKRRQTTAPDEM